MSSVTDKVLSFTVQGNLSFILFIGGWNEEISRFNKVFIISNTGPDERIKLDRKKDDTHEAVQPLEHEINQLADGLKVIRDQQAYMVVREKTHRNSM